VRVLFLTQLLPYPLDSGGKIRNYYLLRHLSRRHRVTLVSFVRSPAEAALADELRPFCEAVHTVLLRRSRLRDCIVGEGTTIEGCDLRGSLIGDQARLRGVRGRVNLGDHSEVEGGPERPEG
jgi:hypothetical protein